MSMKQQLKIEMNCKKGFDNAKSENEAFILELENNDKVLNECMNE